MKHTIKHKTIFDFLPNNHLYAKNIQYPDVRELSQIERVAQLNPTVAEEASILFHQYTSGIQLIVQKPLSDELAFVDMEDIEYSDIVWPASCIEFYFEDLKIPTVLLEAIAPDNPTPFKDKQVYNMTIDGHEFSHGVRMMYQSKEHVHLLTLSSEKVRTWLKMETAFVSPDTDYKVLPDESILRKYLFQLLVKILLYISIPQYKSIPITKKQLLNKGGKPGVKNRPKRPIYRAIYVPTVHYKKENTEQQVSDGTGIQKSPHRRRGHFRILRDERYTNKRGEVVYVRPSLIHGGSTEDKLYIARKVEA